MGLSDYFPESGFSRLMLAVIVAVLVLVIGCRLGWLSGVCDSAKSVFDKKDVGDDGEKEGFDSSPYMDFSDDMYRPGINDERDDGIDMEEMPWSEAIDTLGLEQSVLDSHKAFVQDATRTTTTASNMPTVEFDTDVVPWVGLRRPDYNVLVGSTARTVPSEYTDQLAQRTRFLL